MRRSKIFTHDPLLTVWYVETPPPVPPVDDEDTTPPDELIPEPNPAPKLGPNPIFGNGPSGKNGCGKPPTPPLVCVTTVLPPVSSPNRLISVLNRK